MIHSVGQEQWNTCLNKLNVNCGNVLAATVHFLTWLVCTLPSLHTHTAKRRQAHCSVGVSPWQHWPHAVTGNLGWLLWWVVVTSNLSPSCHGTTPTGSAAISVWCLEPTGNGVTMSHFHSWYLFLCSVLFYTLFMQFHMVPPLALRCWELVMLSFHCKLQ